MSDDPELDEVEARLQRERPALRSSRRQALARRLARLPALPARPAHLWLLVAAFGLSGLALLGFAATQI